MAIDDLRSNERIDKPLMSDYWSTYQTRTYISIVCTQSAMTIGGLGLLELLNVTNLGWIGLIVITIIASALLSAITIALIHILIRPFRDLVRAVVLVSDEPSSLTPPNPNTTEYEKNGFRDILQTIYELAAKANKDVEPATTVNSVAIEGLANTSTGIVILNSDGTIVYNNQSAPVHTETDGSLSLELLFPQSELSLSDWLNKNANKLTAEYQWTRIPNKLPGEKDGRIFDISASYRKNSDAETILTFFDRTNVYMPEEDELDFISFAAHELRGPITVIRGYLDVLQEELGLSMKSDEAELMQRLVVSSNRLASYVNNILNASSYDRRHLKLHLNEETVQRIYDIIADDMQLRASTQNRLLTIDIPISIPTVAADANSVGEVLGNLIDNAIKYSNEGGMVHVTARAISGFVEISVIDRGIGMPDSVLHNLFHKFYRSHRSRETVSGTGIGLYISRAIVSSHGGAITARSTDHEGSTFSFTLPIYDTVAEKLKASDNSNEALIEHGSGWIKNHALYRE